MTAMFIALSHSGLGICRIHYARIRAVANRSQVFLQGRGCVCAVSVSGYFEESFQDIESQTKLATLWAEELVQSVKSCHT